MLGYPANSILSFLMLVTALELWNYKKLATPVAMCSRIDFNMADQGRPGNQYWSKGNNQDLLSIYL